MDFFDSDSVTQLDGLVEKSNIGDRTDNLLIHGDNLSVLKKLIKIYKNRIKCIYIDPPYNTCNEFEHFDDTFTDEEWLKMLKPRLSLLWDFLDESGTIWISIDDNECHYLKILCDELWGRDKFLTMIVRQKNDSPRNYKRRKIVHMQDYVLIYCKNPEKSCINEVTLDYMKDYFVEEKGRKWIADSILAKCSEDDNEKYMYKISTPSGRSLLPPLGRRWSVGEDEFHQLYDSDLLWFGELGDEYPCKKIYKEDIVTLPITSLWTDEMVGSNQEARTEVCAFNQKEFFYVPKPERFIQLILSIATNENDWVLDAYLGSGTTAAVATKMKRHWIGIEKERQCEDFCLPRLEKVVQGDTVGISHSVNWKGGSGFRYLVDINE